MTHRFFGIPEHIKLNVNELYSNGKFINIEEFTQMLINKFSNTPRETTYLALKHTLNNLFGPLEKKDISTGNFKQKQAGAELSQAGLNSVQIRRA